MIFEYAAGGIVLQDGNVLLIRARDLKGRAAWTFPKGHLHNHETSQQAAIPGKFHGISGKFADLRVAEVNHPTPAFLKPFQFNNERNPFFILPFKHIEEKVDNYSLVN